MATRDGQSILAERVPLPVDDAQSVSWRLGTELAAEKPECAHLERADGAGSLTVYEATDHTVLARFRTPVGRETFFGLATLDLEDALDRLPADWRVVRSDC
ncbi:MAG: hypothetical protein ABEJ88_04860 [Halobacterium sp.]